MWHNVKVVLRFLPCRHAVRCCAQSSSSQDTKAKTQVDEWGISLTSYQLQHQNEVKKEIKTYNIYNFFLLVFLSSCRVGSDRLAPAVAVLNPVEVNHAEWGGGDARGSVVVVLVDVQVEGGVAVHIVGGKARPQSLLDRLVCQPLLKLRGPTHIVDDALVAQTSRLVQYEAVTFKTMVREKLMVRECMINSEIE